jgi:lactoylglutathione lyase
MNTCKLIIALTLLIMTITDTFAQKPHMNHLAFSVHNLERSTRFYQEVIGLDTIPEPFHDGRHTWFSVGNGAHLHLIQNSGTIVVPPKDTHLCFSVASVEAVMEQLKKAGIPFEDWPGKKGAVTLRVDKVKQIYFQDPDGYWIEINDARS